MRVLLFVLSTVLLFAAAAATITHPHPDEKMIQPHFLNHRFLQERGHQVDEHGMNESINSLINISIVDSCHIDRRTMNETSLRDMLDHKRSLDIEAASRRRQLLQKGPKATATTEPEFLSVGGNVRGSRQHHRRVKGSKGGKESSKSKEKSSKSKDKKGKKKCKGSKGKDGKKKVKAKKGGKKGEVEEYDDERCEPQVVYLEYPGTPHFYVDRCYIYCDPHHYYYCHYHCGNYAYETYQYTQDDKDEIQDRLESMFEGYNIEFTQTEPSVGEYSTVTFECQWYEGCIWDYGGRHSILFGAAEKIDLFNKDRSDNAFVQAQFWQYLKLNDANDVNLRAYTDAYNHTKDRDEAYTMATICQATGTAAHEIGHLLGLRHHDSLGPPGKGIVEGLSPYDFYPTYDGLDEADETFLHTMGSGASVGSPLYYQVKRDDFFSARSMVKLLSNEQASILREDDVGGLDNTLKFNKLETDITLPEGINAGKELDLQELFIQGRIGEMGETDFYCFEGKKGEFISAEFNGFDIYDANDPDYDVVIGGLSLFRANEDGTWTLVAKNHQNFEGFDALMIDAELPEDGKYIMEVYAPDALQLGYFRFISLDLWGLSEFRIGNYHVSIYKMKAVEEDS